MIYLYDETRKGMEGFVVELKMNPECKALWKPMLVLGSSMAAEFWAFTNPSPEINRTHSTSTFEFRSVDRLHLSGSEAGPISISHFINLPQFFIMLLHSIHISHFMCAWGWSEAGNLSHFILSLSSAEIVKVVRLSHFIPPSWSNSHVKFWADFGPEKHYNGLA